MTTDGVAKSLPCGVKGGFPEPRHTILEVRRPERLGLIKEKPEQQRPGF